MSRSTEIAEQQRAAAVQSADALRRIADGLDAANAREERLERARGPLEPFRRPDRTYDALGRQEPRNPFRGSLGVATLLRLGMGREFVAVVPSPCWTDGGVLCRCGETVAIEVGEVVECAGGCSRFFLRSESSVRVARWAPAEDEGEVG